MSGQICVKQSIIPLFATIRLLNFANALLALLHRRIQSLKTSWQIEAYSETLLLFLEFSMKVLRGFEKKLPSMYLFRPKVWRGRILHKVSSKNEPPVRLHGAKNQIRDRGIFFTTSSSKKWQKNLDVLNFSPTSFLCWNQMGFFRMDNGS